MSGRPQRVLRSSGLLRVLMTSAGHNTVTLAAAAGVRKQVVSYLTSGARTSCSKSTAEGIARVLECQAETLFYDPLEEEASANRREGEEMLLTIAEAAEAIGVSKAHAYRLVGDGELRVVDVGRAGSKKPKSRVPLVAITEFIAAREAAQS